MNYLLFFLLLITTGFTQTMNSLGHKDKIIYFFENLTKDKLHLVTEFYHPQVKFIDPVGTLDSAEKIKRYYEGMYKNVNRIKFDFSEFHESGKTVVAVWTMTLETEKLNSGDPIKVDGNSVITFDDEGKAIYHRDYFDMGAFVYEHIPMVGFVVKKIKNRMKSE
jgi:hypothetical protein